MFRRSIHTVDCAQSSLKECSGLNVFSSKSCVEIWLPLWQLGGGTFWRRLGYEDSVLRGGIGAILKRWGPPFLLSCPAFNHVLMQQKPAHQMLTPSSWTSRPLALWENKFILYKLLWLRHPVIAAQNGLGQVWAKFFKWSIKTIVEIIYGLWRIKI